jgi:hypothetical protein
MKIVSDPIKIFKHSTSTIILLSEQKVCCWLICLSERIKTGYSLRYLYIVYKISFMEKIRKVIEFVHVE